VAWHVYISQYAARKAIFYLTSIYAYNLAFYPAGSRFEADVVIVGGGPADPKVYELRGDDFNWAEHSRSLTK